jgi:hypothetical protein
MQDTVSQDALHYIISQSNEKIFRIGERSKYPAATFLRKVTSPIYGYTYHGAPAHRSREQVLDELQEKGYVKGLKNKDYEAHGKGEKSYYFQADATKDYCLMLFDIDVKKAAGLGSEEGGQRFADYLADQFFPHLYTAFTVTSSCAGTAMTPGNLRRITTTSMPG